MHKFKRIALHNESVKFSAWWCTDYNCEERCPDDPIYVDESGCKSCRCDRKNNFDNDTYVQ